MKIDDWSEESLKKQGFKKGKDGEWLRKNHKFFYKESCKVCNEPFLTSVKNGKFCSKRCAQLGENGSNYGKHLLEETKRKIGKAVSGEKNGFYGKKHTKENLKKYSEAAKLRIGKKNSNWRGGYSSKNIPKYDLYAPQIEWCEEVRRNKKDPNVLEVRCYKCKEWFAPSLISVYCRIKAINKQLGGEQHFYCSDGCKNSCSIYWKTPKQIMKEDAIRAGRLQWLQLEREVQPELRKLVIDIYGYQCVKCGSTEKGLHCHHIYPASTDPIESADIDNCMMVCIDCHHEIHKKDGCKLGQLEVCVEYE